MQITLSYRSTKVVEVGVDGMTLSAAKRKICFVIPETVADQDIAGYFASRVDAGTEVFGCTKASFNSAGYAAAMKSTDTSIFYL